MLPRRAPPPREPEMTYIEANENTRKIFLQQGMPFISTGTSHGAYPGSRSDPVTVFAFLGFGATGMINDWDTFCITPSENRTPLREHPAFLTSFGPDLKRLAVPVKVATIPGKGRGLRAIRDISAGETLLIERPLVVFSDMMDEGTSVNLDMYIDKGLTPEHKGELYSLHNCKSKAPGMVESLSILRTNALPTNLPFNKSESHAGVFHRICRANHSCMPNATYDWSSDYFTGMLRSLRPIKQGEEVLITYLSNTPDTAAHRKAELLRKYSFECSCPACSLPDAARKASDERRCALLQRYPPKKALIMPNDLHILCNGYNRAFIEESLHMCEIEGLFEERVDLLIKYAECEAMRARFSGDFNWAAELAKWAMKEIQVIGWFSEWSRMDDILKEKIKMDAAPPRPNFIESLRQKLSAEAEVSLSLESAPVPAPNRELAEAHEQATVEEQFQDAPES